MSVSKPEVPQFLRYVDDLPMVKMRKYRLLRFTESGGYGRIFEATLRDDPDGRRFALKLKNANEDITLIERKEIHALKTLENEKNIIKMLDIIKTARDFVIVMPLARTDLHRLLQKRDLLITEGERKSILFQLFSGISAIHKNKLIHRDIKPGNILISCDGIVQITDFGISERLIIGEKRIPHGGTLYYKALELLLEDDQYDEKVDLWAAGCTMAELYTRKRLFEPIKRNIMYQIEAIIVLCGFPTEKVWPRVVTFQFFSQIEYSFGHLKRRSIQARARDITQRNFAAADLLLELLAINPEDRFSAKDSLSHRYFTRATVQPDVKSLIERMH